MGTGTEPNERTPRIRANPQPVSRGYSRANLKRSRKGFCWGDLDPDDIGKFVTTVCRNGAGIILGVTSDGGALSITILEGDERIREYPSNKEDFDELYSWAAERYGALR